MYGLNDLDAISQIYSSKSYNPVNLAASISLNLPVNMLQSTSYNNFNYNRRRLSLIEALNNSIQDDFCSPTTNLSIAGSTAVLPKPQSPIYYNSTTNLNNNNINNNNSFYEDEMSKSAILKQHEPERIYSVRQILNQNHDLLDRGRLSMRVPRIYVKNSRDESFIQEVPRIVRTRVAKRSKSQPNNNGGSMGNSSQESDLEYDSPSSSHISRVDCEESSWQRGCRCSLQSTSSSIASRSGSTSSGDSGIVLAEASWDHVALMPDELPFASGDVITVIDTSSQSGLWYGSCRDSQGWFPSSHVRILSTNSRPTSSCTPSEWDPHLRKRRGKVVEELLHTERDYVRLLEDIVQGFMEQTRRRPELFNANRIRNIFGNIHSIYVVHSKLLRDLEMALDQSTPENSNIGAAFLRNKHAFSIYSEYCNNRPVSCAELAQLSRQSIYRQFFEACRLLRGMPNLSLEGFLLTPVQRICRYPLQLAELLKATPVWHEDAAALEAAEKCMRDVTASINDRKRRVETLQELARWQRNVHGWRGPDLLENNSAMLRSGEVHIRVVANGHQQYAKDLIMFLFDQSIVFCKKDPLKKNCFIFKDRLSLNLVNLVDCKDGKDSTFNCSVKNSLKLVCNSRQILITCPDKKAKASWLSAFDTGSSKISPVTAEEKRLALASLHSMEFI
ncbi:unnamed protein product [Auanema sp. JU1783]|nr:unnamed protein product [Auanema sp. JU1783]